MSTCPLCFAEADVSVTMAHEAEEITVRCGLCGAFRILGSTAEEWAKLNAHSNPVGLEQARKWLAERRLLAETPVVPILMIWNWALAK